MYIQFDPNNLHVQVICGSNESFEPTEEIKSIQDKVNVLSEETKAFTENVYKVKMKEIQDLVESENGKFKAKQEALANVEEKTAVEKAV